MIGQQLRVRVAELRDVTPTIRQVRLVSCDDQPLPPTAPGAHIQLNLPGGERTLRNAYSLINPPGSRDAYVIAVRRVAQSRGGSAYIHENLKIGQTLSISWPANLFAPVLSAPRHLLIAGGIGITPFMAYMAMFAHCGIDFELHLCCQESEQAALRQWLPDLPQIHLHWLAAGHELDLSALLSQQTAGTHLYVCGPDQLNDQVLTLAAELGWPENHVHCERFGSALAGGRAFKARLARSGKDIEVADNESLLEALERSGVSPANLCRGGACGVCIMPVLEGTPEHRDHFLSAAERQSNRHIMPCVSRACSELLVLDI